MFLPFIYISPFVVIFIFSLIGSDQDEEYDKEYHIKKTLGAKAYIKK